MTWSASWSSWLVFCDRDFLLPGWAAAISWKRPNYEPANPHQDTPRTLLRSGTTPPYYAILRAVPSIAGSAGVIAMGGAIAILFVLPWLDRSPVKSIRYKGWMSKSVAGAFRVISFVRCSGYLGAGAV
jgi:ubiquinol-cytochrome c reductase cytochrome b subunit